VVVTVPLSQGETLREVEAVLSPGKEPITSTSPPPRGHPAPQQRRDVTPLLPNFSFCVLYSAAPERGKGTGKENGN